MFPRRINDAAMNATKQIMDGIRPVLLEAEVRDVFEFIMLSLKEAFANYEEQRARELLRLTPCSKN